MFHFDQLKRITVFGREHFLTKKMSRSYVGFYLLADLSSFDHEERVNVYLCNASTVPKNGNLKRSHGLPKNGSLKRSHVLGSNDAFVVTP